MISLRNPNTQNIMNRQQLIEDYAQIIVDGMDLDTLVEFAYDTLTRNLEELSDSQLIAEIQQFNPEILEDNDIDVSVE